MNSNLTAAKRNKNDEFYTQLSDIENELKHYRKHFAGKTVYCNCDDGVMSNFFKYFMLNFKFLGLDRLIATSYGRPVSDERAVEYAERLGDEYMTLSDETKRKFASDSQLRFEYIGEPDNADMPRWSSVIVTELEGDGDFRSDESIKFLKESDIVVTNPPFSLFREYVAQLIEYEKEFVVLGNMNAVSYKEIFPLIKENKLWYGPSISSGDREFQVPESYPLTAASSRIDEDGNRFVRVKGVRWFTNIDHLKRHEELILYKQYDPKYYPKYDNYDAINVDKVKEIPEDYDGVMGVPITFLDKYNPEQFEIVNANEYRRTEQVRLKPHGLVKDKESAIDGKPKYVRILIKNKKVVKS